MTLKLSTGPMQDGQRHTFTGEGMTRLFRSALLAVAIVGLGGCAATGDGNKQKYQVRPTIFEPNGKSHSNDQDYSESQQQDVSRPGFSRVQSMAEMFELASGSKKVAGSFSDTEMVSYSVDKMKLNEFIHHIFGGVLGVNYVVNNELTGKLDPVTLNFQNKISKRQAFIATNEVLRSKNVGVSYKEGTYYLYPMSVAGGVSVAIGVGREYEDMPPVGDQVLQIMPLHFGVSPSVERTLRSLTNIELSVDLSQSAIFLKGERQKVQKVMELARLLDMPANRGKHIGLIRLTFVNADEFSNQLKALLGNEGIGVDINKGQQGNVVLVPINHIGLMAVFASSEQFLNRVRFWKDKIDIPSQDNVEQYFWYEPEHARAADLGKSLAPLFGQAAPVAAPAAGNSSRDTRSALSGTKQTVNSASVVSDGLSMVVDERTNTLIFQTTGKRYQQLLPLIRRMDTVPRQIMLEATIAEVTMSDGFKYGVQFAMENGSFGYSGAFNSLTGGFGATWAKANDSIKLNLIESNDLINVLSNPSLLVRDGTSASITVGDEIPLKSSVLSNPFEGSSVERETFERRQTGLTLRVTPTVNSQGVVIMEVDLNISNANDQNLLNRQVTTEVVASSGQTIIIAGLISENTTNTDSKIPVLGDIPVVGNLFKSKDDSTKKTELVILVTPKIISDGNQWSDIKNKFRKGLENVEF